MIVFFQPLTLLLRPQTKAKIANCVARRKTAFIHETLRNGAAGTGDALDLAGPLAQGRAHPVKQVGVHVDG